MSNTLTLDERQFNLTLPSGLSLRSLNPVLGYVEKSLSDRKPPSGPDDAEGLRILARKTMELRYITEVNSASLMRITHHFPF